jgi:hypothetical protein
MFSKKLKKQGKDAYKAGKCLKDNPFIRHSNPAKSSWWEAGWLEAERETRGHGQ